MELSEDCRCLATVLTEDAILDAITVAALLHRATVVTESRTESSAWTADEPRVFECSLLASCGRETAAPRTEGALMPGPLGLMVTQVLRGETAAKCPEPKGPCSSAPSVRGAAVSRPQLASSDP